MTPRRPASKYDELADAYDTRWALYIAKSIAHTLTCVTPKDGDVLLDIGCGTGQLLRAAQAHWPSLRCYGVDPSREMLLAGPAPARQVIHATGECLPIRDASIDWVVSTSAFHYLTDPRAALREWRRVLRPEGTLVITDWCRDYATIRALSAWERISGSIQTRVYTAAELRALLVECTFEQVNIDRYRINWFWGLVTAAARRPAGV